MRRIWVPLILCLLAVASTGCEKARLRKQLKELMGSTIVLPERIVCVDNGEVIPMPDSLRHIPKLIVYIDSVECTSCRISHIEIYDPLFRISKEQQTFQVFLLLANMDLNGIPLTRFLSDMKIAKPIYLDVENCFLKKNPMIPEDRRLHAFFTDTNGTVVSIGDPALSEKRLRVFIKSLEELTNKF